MMNKFNNLPELFYFQADKNENNQHLLKLDSNNQVVSMSWLETKKLTKKIHNFLANKYSNITTTLGFFVYGLVPINLVSVVLFIFDPLINYQLFFRDI